MTVMLVNGAANRDPRHFEAPTEVRLDRENARDQLAFSRGVHVCLGQSLARAEGRVTLERVLDRMADIRISEAAPRSRRCPPLGVPTDLALPRTHRPAPRVHPHRHLSPPAGCLHGAPGRPTGACTAAPAIAQHREDDRSAVSQRSPETAPSRLLSGHRAMSDHHRHGAGSGGRRTSRRLAVRIQTSILSSVHPCLSRSISAN